MIFALIPAAGKSTRMGRSKLALPLGDRTVLEHVIRALRQAEIEHILVVIGHHVSELAPLAKAAGANVLSLAEETADMRATVEHGLAWLEDRFHPDDGDNWLLLPADHPTLDSGVVRQLVEARHSHPQYSIVVPTYHGRRGHPALIAWKHVTAILASRAGEGLNAFLRRQAAETLEVSVDSPGILADLDTRADYEILRNG